MDREQLYQCPYIVWVYYHCEGWSARPCASWEDAMTTVLDGQLGGECVVTSGAFMPARP